MTALFGTVLAAHGRHYLVEAGQLLLNCVTRGKKSDVAVGDLVEYKLTSVNQGVIESISERKTLLYRSDQYRSKLLAANLTQLFIVVATQPGFSDDLISRALVAAEAGGIRPHLVLNKIDVIDLLPAAKKRLDLYAALGYPVHLVSAKTNPDQTLATSGTILQGNGTNYVASSMTFPTSVGTSGTILKSNGTNWVASTETYAAPGSAGNVMTSDGTNWTSGAANQSINTQVFTSSGTWTKPTGLKYAVVETIGGGGGGGGESPVGGGCSGGGWSGGGGGSGAYATRKITAAQLGSTETVTVSSSGGAGASGSSTAGSGATNSFGSWVSASGGTGGASQAPGSAGTSSSTYATIVAGSAGSSGNTGGCSGINGANGGSSFYGTGGTGGTSNGNNATGYGAGGQGASNAAGVYGYTGGNGTAGVVIVTNYF